MGDTALLVAAVGLGLSGVVSAIKLIDWFLRSDPKEILQIGRWGAVGLFALLIPLLIGLAVNRRWLEAFGLSAAMLIAFALYGPRILGQLTPRRRLVPDGSRLGGSEPADAPPDAEMVQRSIAVLEDYLRCTTGAFEHDASHVRASPSQITDGRSQGDTDRDHREPPPPLMSEAEALEVLDLPPDTEASEINEAHRRLMQIVHPDRGGSRYFAVKVNQAKEILLELRTPPGPSTSGAQEERSPRDGGQLHPSESRSTRRR
jgi:hypothetical protein